MNKKTYIFELPMGVRDYECDVEGIVNNANYLHYMEHTRHQFLLTEGVSFIDLHHRGIDCVVARITVNYKTPLRSDDQFLSCLNIKKEGVKYVFLQDIYRMPDRQLCMRATVETVCIVNGKLSDCQELNAAFGKYF
ncbi:MAG: YbgC/FadM family acyl-CoA thioesterase [Bacteroidaceae bacterium]|nr:YbgC/FadM family acyl-CoA thioesterase [Bacteroidaceae bacterium]